MSTDYGAFKELVAMSGCLMSTGGAIALGWKRRSRWEPVEDDVPNGPQRVCSLVSVLGIGLLWGNRQQLDRTLLTALATGFGIICVLALLAYILLTSVFVYIRKVPIAARQVRDDKIIGGFYVRPDVPKVLAGPPIRTVQEVLATRQYDPDKVWPRLSRGLAKVCFVLAYLGLSAGGTLALSAASLLAGRALPP